MKRRDILIQALKSASGTLRWTAETADSPYDDAASSEQWRKELDKMAQVLETRAVRMEQKLYHNNSKRMLAVKMRGKDRS